MSFKIEIFNPKEENFPSKERYEDYREHTRCAVCHEKLEPGDRWFFQPLTALALRSTCQAVIVHEKCASE